MGQLLSEFGAWLTVRCGRAALTVQGYQGVVRRCAEALGTGDVAAWTLEAVQAHLDERQVSARTKQHDAAALRAFLRFCARQGLCSDFGRELEVPQPRRRRLPPVLTVEEAARLVEAPIRLAPPEEPSVYHLRDAALLELYYGSGMRASELTQLDVKSLRWRSAGYLAFRTIGKGDKERLIIVERGAATAAVRAYLARRSEIPGAASCPALFLNWWGGRLTRRGAAYVVRKWARRAGLDAWPHLLRHSYATAMVSAAGEALRGVQELMGHDDPAQTARYAQVDEARLRRTAALHPRADRRPSLRELGEKAADLGRTVVELLGLGARTSAA